MANTNTSEDAYLIARTSMDLAFGIIERLAERKIFVQQDIDYIRSRGYPAPGISSKADRDMLADHIKQTLDAIALRCRS